MSGLTWDIIFGVCFVGFWISGLAVVLVPRCGDHTADTDSIEFSLYLGEHTVIRLQYISEHIMNTKTCSDGRAALPWLVVVFFIGVLVQWYDTCRAWQSNIHASDAPYSGLLNVCLFFCCIGMLLLVTFDHIGRYHILHNIAVIVLFVGLLGVHVITSVCQSTENQQDKTVPNSRPSNLKRRILCWVYSAFTCMCFIIAVAFVSLVCFGNDISLQLSVLTEYLLAIFIFLISTINLYEFTFIQTRVPYTQLL
jgi:hypothetical protein